MGKDSHGADWSVAVQNDKIAIRRTGLDSFAMVTTSGPVLNSSGSVAITGGGSIGSNDYSVTTEGNEENRAGLQLALFSLVASLGAYKPTFASLRILV